MFNPFKRRQASPGLTAVGVDKDGVCLVRALREPGARPRIVQWDLRSTGTNGTQADVLAALARDYDLRHARCTTPLNDGDYQLLLTEAPDVNPDELKAALRWRVKDLINFHINDASLDVFELPGAPASGRAREMYVVAARNPAIQARVDMMDTAGINLGIIDIPELAHRNIASLLPQDVNGVAMLALKPMSGLITLTRQGLMYLSRSLTMGYEALQGADRSTEYFDQIALEIHRSLDYFESRFREAPIRDLVIAPTPMALTPLIDHLRANLNVQVFELDLNQVLASDKPMPAALQARCLPTIGAALRHEVKAL